MTLRTALGAADVRATMVAYRDALRSHQQVLNRLNVYPVPDGDTGTNMTLTLDAVVSELEGMNGTGAMPDVCRAMAHGSLMGARGNSGVILSQLLRGIAERLGGDEEVGPEDLAAALVSASGLARAAVVRPVEGTILTVARAAGEGATAGWRAGETLAGVVDQAHRAAAEALAATPTMLEPLARAGVVDAGGWGYVLLLDAMLTVIDGRPLPDPPEPDAAAEDGRRVTPVDTTGEPAVRGPGMAPEDLRYEVMYLLDAPDDAIGPFKEVWAGMGDSIVVVGGEGVWNCHIHTNDIGAAVEAAIDIGRPHQIRVTDLAEQVEEERWVRDAAHGPPSEARSEPQAPPPVTGVVAVVAGDGIGRIFRSLGAQRLVPGGQTMNPSTAQLLEAVESLASAEVVVLPNNDNIEPVAKQLDALTDKVVRVVPTGSIVEGFAALLAYDPGASAAENEAAMAASACRVIPGAVTRAVRDADTEVGPVHEGEWLGLTRTGIVSTGGSPAGAALGLLEGLIGDSHELVTVIEGEGATPVDTRRITEWLREEHPQVAPEIHHGGQPLYPYLFGIE
jgi:uncharacterized protein